MTITSHIENLNIFSLIVIRKINLNQTTIIYEGNDEMEVVITCLNPDDFRGNRIFSTIRSKKGVVSQLLNLQVAEISYTNFNIYVRSHPEIVFTIGQQMTHRLTNTARKIGDLAYYDVIGHIVNCSRKMTGCVLKILEEQA